jgi:hypothetical protein
LKSKKCKLNKVNELEILMNSLRIWQARIRSFYTLTLGFLKESALDALTYVKYLLAEQ